MSGDVTPAQPVLAMWSSVMADHFCQFSCIFDVGSIENAVRADDIRGELAAELDRDDGAVVGFVMEVDHENNPGLLWLHSDEHGEPEHVIRFVLRCAEAFDMSGLWGFTWALSCTKPRIDAFGGGAQLLDLGKRASIDWLDCEHWLQLHLAPNAGTAASPPNATLEHGDDSGTGEAAMRWIDGDRGEDLWAREQKRDEGVTK